MTVARKILRSKLTTGIIWMLIALMLPTILNLNTFKLGQFNFILAVVMVSIGLNLVLGYAGQLFLGPGALFAGGAYAAAYLGYHHTAWQSLPMMCVAAVLTAFVIAAIAALPTLRVGGFYLGLVTLFMAQAIPLYASHTKSLGQENGLSFALVRSFFQHPKGRQLYEVGVLMAGALAGYCYLIVHSRLGRRFTALRSGDDLAQAVAVPTYTTKLVVFLLSAVPCGVGGAYYVYSQQFISPQSVSPTLSIFILAGMVIGGGGTIIGPILGTAIVMAAQEFLGRFAKYEGIVFGSMLIIVAATLPNGLMGLALSGRAWWSARKGHPMQFGPDFGDIPDTSGIDAEEAFASNPGERLVVNNVSRHFGGVHAVVDVDLVVEPGTVHALVGPNGSGKTTLLNLICGFYRLHGGEITLGDKRLDGHSVAAVTKMGVGRTFQTPKLSIYDTAFGNVLVGADRGSKGKLAGTVIRTRKSRREEKKATERALQALASVGLHDEAWSLVNGLSHGTQRLVEIARAMALQPKLLLLDEPAAGLSVAEAEVLKDTVRKLARSGLSVLLVEHNLPVVFDVADYVTVLHQGEVLASGNPAEVSSDPEVIRVYLGRSRPDPRAAEVLLAEVGDDH